jgi:hypothetical protein
MAREEEAREDLLREATALVVRIELSVEEFAEPIVAGFRRDGAASFFFGQQVVYQFNAEKQLRRAFLDNRLYKAECSQLVQLTRQRTETIVNLLRHELTDVESSQFLSDCHHRLQQLQTALATSCFQIIGQVPPDANVAAQIRDWLANLPATIPLANSPRVS